MISLVQLLKEVQGSPKAIFLAGPAGSGKSYISSKLIPKTFIVINSDDTYEELLKASGIGLKQKDFTPDQLSQASKLQAQARKSTQDKFIQSVENKNNIVIDGTGAASGPILKKKQQLEDLGYETLMLMIYVSPLTSLERNQQRDRSLMPGIVLRTWRDVNKNIESYRQSFGNNFILLNNNPKDSKQEFNADLLKPYLQSSSAVGKPKTPEEQAKSNSEKIQLNKDIESMVNKLPEFDTLDNAKNKINEFIS
jgi:dephospho-CoA kinase